jgi:hypothetical protein
MAAVGGLLRALWPWSAAGPAPAYAAAPRAPPPRGPIRAARSLRDRGSQTDLSRGALAHAAVQSDAAFDLRRPLRAAAGSRGARPTAPEHQPAPAKAPFPPETAPPPAPAPEPLIEGSTAAAEAPPPAEPEAEAEPGFNSALPKSVECGPGGGFKIGLPKAPETEAKPGLNSALPKSAEGWPSGGFKIALPKAPETEAEPGFTLPLPKSPEGRSKLPFPLADAGRPWGRERIPVQAPLTGAEGKPAFQFPKPPLGAATLLKGKPSQLTGFSFL